MSEEPVAEAVEDAFEPVMRRAKKLGTMAGIVGAAIGVCLSVAFLAQTSNPNYRGALGMPFVGAMGAFGMVLGLTLIMAPSSFFTSPQGRQYLQTIGTNSVVGARIVIGIFLLIGLGMIGIFVFLALSLLGVIPDQFK